MRSALRLSTLSLFIGGAVSLKHGNFVASDKNETDVGGPIEFHSALDFFGFFTPLPPVPPPPTNQPTNQPTEKPKPTPAPIRTPTGPPIPAGRFPSPVAPPTLKPVEPVPVPVGRWPVAKPTNKPIPGGPVATHNIPPTFEPNPVSTPTKAYVPTSPAHPVHPTRIATYTAEWGSDVNDCEYVIPNIFVNCQGGGLIGITEAYDAQCTQVANDRVQCTQIAMNSEASVKFTCSGTKTDHLFATATVGPNLAAECSRDGNAVKFLTLNRDCGHFIDTNPTCAGGFPWLQNDSAYCAAPAICNKQTCNELKIESVSMTNKNEDPSCSLEDPNQDLHSHSFDVSSLFSITQVEWRVSGQRRGCLWKSTPLSMKCENGGKLEFVEDYSFCSVKSDGTSGECESFAPYSMNSEDSTELFVRCTGEKEEQLVLTVESQSINLDVECNLDGTIIQSIMLSRGCGQYGTDSFLLLNHRSFCHDQNAVFTVDENHAYCYVGDTCLSRNGCHNIELNALVADTGSGTLGLCTNVV